MHGELAEVERAPAELEKIVPLCETALVVPCVAVDDFDIRGADTPRTEVS
jgi:hypothetical protein